MRKQSGTTSAKATLAALDRRLAALLQRRAKAVLAAHGAQAGISDAVQREMAADIAAASAGALDRTAVAAVFREIISASQALVHPRRIAYMGPRSSFTHQAALQHFGAACTFVATDSIGDVFRAVAKGEADFGVVPVENSNEGMVSYTLDRFIDADVQICAEEYVDVHQNLLSRTSIDRITKVYSMPMVWGQCRDWLAKNLAHAEQADVYSTARAAELAAQEENCGAIASSLAADIFKLDILASAIEDFSQNITRFLVISAEPAPRTKRSKTSILFSIKDRAGALYGALKPFRDAKLNLTKIESRPSKLKAWEYYFFVDLIGHAADPAVARALEKLAIHCNFVKVLGSYPNAAPQTKR